MFRTVSFWVLLVLGVPLIVGELFKLLCVALLEAGIGERWKRIPEAIFELFGGVVSIAVGGVLAAWMGMQFSLWVPVVILAVLIVWLSARGELKAVLPGGFGIAAGYAAWLLSR